jgi:isoprenylcysteine carboxyl methyltransferase (ICMT) family protein YpbQ
MAKQNQGKKYQQGKKVNQKAAQVKKPATVSTEEKKQARPAVKQSKTKETFALGKENYMLMGIGLVIIIIGFIIMAQRGEDKFAFMQTGVSTILVIFGFLFEIYAIMKKPKSLENTEE